MLILHAAWALKPPPERYPDLYPALFSLYGCANLVCVYILGVMWQLQACAVSDFDAFWNLFANSTPKKIKSE